MNEVKVTARITPPATKADAPRSFVTRTEKRTNALIAKLIAEREKKASKPSKAAV